MLQFLIIYYWDAFALLKMHQARSTNLTVQIEFPIPVAASRAHGLLLCSPDSRMASLDVSSAVPASSSNSNPSSASAASAYLCPTCLQTFACGARRAHELECGYSYCAFCAECFSQSRYKKASTAPSARDAHQKKCGQKQASQPPVRLLPLHLCLLAHKWSNSSTAPVERLVSNQPFLQRVIAQKDASGDTALHLLCGQLADRWRYHSFERHSAESRVSGPVSLFHAFLKAGADVFARSKHGTTPYCCLFPINDLTERHGSPPGEAVELFHEIVRRYCDRPQPIGSPPPSHSLVHIAAALQVPPTHASVQRLLQRDGLQSLLVADAQHRTPTTLAVQCNRSHGPSTSISDYDAPDCSPPVALEWLKLLVNTAKPRAVQMAHLWTALEVCLKGARSDRTPSEVLYHILQLGGPTLFQQEPSVSISSASSSFDSSFTKTIFDRCPNDSTLQLLLVRAYGAGYGPLRSLYPKLFQRVAEAGWLESLQLLLTFPWVDDLDCSEPDAAEPLHCTAWYVLWPDAWRSQKVQPGREEAVIQMLLSHATLTPRLPLTSRLLEARVAGAASFLNEDGERRSGCDEGPSDSIIQERIRLVRRILILRPAMSLVLPTKVSSSAWWQTQQKTILDRVPNDEVLYLLLQDDRSVEALKVLRDHQRREAERYNDSYLPADVPCAVTAWMNQLRRFKDPKHERYHLAPQYYYCTQDPTERADRIARLFMTRGNEWSEIWCQQYFKEMFACQQSGDFPSKYPRLRSVFLLQLARDGVAPRLREVLSDPYQRACHSFCQAWIVEVREMLRRHLCPDQNDTLPNLLLSFVFGDDPTTPIPIGALV